MKQTIQLIKKDLKTILFLLIIFGVWYVAMHLVFQTCCIQLVIFGIPCAGCGMTRAFLAVLQGQFVNAFYWNPAIYLWLGFVIFMGYQRYIRFRMKNIMQALIVVCVFSLMIYGYRMYTMFPEKTPMCIYSDCLMAKRFPGYREWISMTFY